MKMKRYTCLRCKHSWIPRTDNIPKICPKCRSPYWDREFVRKRKQDEEQA